MKNSHFIIPFLLLSILLPSFSASAQDRTVGLIFSKEGASNGYTLFAPMSSTTTYLIDGEGRTVRTWESQYRPGLSVYLLESGNLLRTANDRSNQGGTVFGTTGGVGGLVQEFDWEGNLVWEYPYSSSTYRQHHDIERLPNGNVLMIAWEVKSSEEAIGAGRNPSLLPDNQLWPDHIIEVEPVGQSEGKIVWEWHAWDHLVQEYDPTKENYGVVSAHPELIDLNRVTANGSADWLHTNSIDYNPTLDQILLSLHNLNEIWIIDHSTTTEEAATHTGGKSGRGGDILYRWGNPANYGAGSAEDQQLFSQHDAEWIAPDLPGAGHILTFNNGVRRPDGNYSSVDEIVPPYTPEGTYTRVEGTAYGPEEILWSYTASNPTDFYSSNISGAGRLPSGNTLICEGDNGRFFEVLPTGEIVWEYINPVIASGPLTQGSSIPVGMGGGTANTVFRADHYAPDYAGFVGRDLTPGDFIERYSSGVVQSDSKGELRMTIIPQPLWERGTIQLELSHPATLSMALFNSVGSEVLQVVEGREVGAGSHAIPIALSSIPSGWYFCKVTLNDKVEMMPCLVVKE
ncbi:MAG: aryl-sulfate sulfotransferase [Ignavibacteriae bacterium]|nr:aryl-sulfate sulfotransferase [Ignavibacteriota bacterium]MCB9217483.1 aryl-sulfate sulfotransferase [Ignavibacteria bacterium]